MTKFIIFLIRWIGSNLAIPFWMVGHVHLSINIYKDIHEIIASFGMNFIVLIALYYDWKEHIKTKKDD